MFNLEFNDFIVNKYKTMKLFKEGLAPVQNYEGLWGFINKEGEEVIPCQYSDFRYFHEDLAAVQNDEGLWGYIYTCGELLIPFKYEFAFNFCCGVASVIKSVEPCVEEVYIDMKGNELRVDTSSIYDSLPKSFFFENLIKFFTLFIRLSISGKFNFNTFWDIIINERTINERTRFLQENVGKKVEGGEDLIGFVDLKGRDKLFCKKTEYIEIKDFSEGLAAVQNVNGLWGFINKEGEEVITCQFKSCSVFSEGLSHVTGNDGLSYYIDKKGNKKLELYTYHSYLELPNKTIIIKADSEEELNKKKVETLSLAKQEILSFVDSQIDQAAYAIPKPNEKKKKRS